eukprot:TRINITY_DN8537_c0_g1_i1.p1 TRINITY_DN8537_c0_g1~~TRINITY_DN8537_c0_g1_i1.p1  ORF type:complete len:874 (-),score=175.95 TRINITY_DN8537_c0_g1_i1:39-2660(-)
MAPTQTVLPQIGSGAAAASQLTAHEYGLLPLSMIGPPANLALPPLHDGYNVTLPYLMPAAAGVDGLRAEESRERASVEEQESGRRAVLRAVLQDFVQSRKGSGNDVGYLLPLDFLMLGVDMLCTKENKIRDGITIEENMQRIELHIRLRTELETQRAELELQKMYAPAPPKQTPRSAPRNLTAAPELPVSTFPSAAPKPLPRDQRNRLPIGPEHEAQLRAQFRFQKDELASREDIMRQEADHRSLLGTRFEEISRELAAETMQRAWRSYAARHELWRRSSTRVPAINGSRMRTDSSVLFSPEATSSSRPYTRPLAGSGFTATSVSTTNVAASVEFREALLAKIEELTLQLDAARTEIFAFVQENFPTAVDIGPQNDVAFHAYLLPTTELERLLLFLAGVQDRLAAGRERRALPFIPPPAPMPTLPPLPAAVRASATSYSTPAAARSQQWRAAPPTGGSALTPQDTWADYDPQLTPAVPPVGGTQAAQEDAFPKGNLAAQAYYFLFVAELDGLSKRRALAQFIRELREDQQAEVLAEVKRHGTSACVVEREGVPYIQTAAFSDFLFERIARQVMALFQGEKTADQLKAELELQRLQIMRERELEALRRERVEAAAAEQRWAAREAAWKKAEEERAKLESQAFMKALYDEEVARTKRNEELQRHEHQLLLKLQEEEIRDRETRRRLERLQKEEERIAQELELRQQHEERRRRDWESRFGPAPPKRQANEPPPVPKPPATPPSRSLAPRQELQAGPVIQYNPRPPLTQQPAPKAAPPGPQQEQSKPAERNSNPEVSDRPTSQEQPVPREAQVSLAKAMATLSEEQQHAVRRYIADRFGYCVRQTTNNSVHVDTSLLRPKDFWLLKAHVAGLRLQSG